MFKRYQYLIFILSFVSLSACLLDCNGGTSDERVIVRSMYHWKSDFSLDEDQNRLLQNLRVEEVYLHLFDVVWDGEEAIPTTITSIQSEPEQKLVPVIYITTDVFTHLDSIGISELSTKVSQKVTSQMNTLSFSEIQFDCDWMPSIKDKYFYFLDEIKAHFADQSISATIRLYQYKYPELAGVPPVDKGMLMYYNMGDLTDEDETNSILNNQKGFQYLGFNDYPLPIDLALPNFEWAAVFRGGQFLKLTNDFSEQDCKKGNLFSKASEYYYFFEKDTVIKGNYYRYGDLIRPESSSKEDLEKAAGRLVDELNQDTTRIIFYDLRKNTIKDYEKLDAIYTLFE